MKYQIRTFILGYLLAVEYSGTDPQDTIAVIGLNGI